MSVKLGKQTIKLSKKISLMGAASIVGVKESEGPLSPYFDIKLTDAEWGEETWEKCESKMQREAIKLSIENSGLSINDIDVMFAGDLLNQCTSSGFSAREIGIPFFGIYGACSTMIEGLGLASMIADGDGFKTANITASSHFCTAERQYRNPLEYGGQRTPTAQWTVTGAGSMTISSKPTDNGPCITHATCGRVVDFGICDVNNMGAAMAPAAADTLLAHFKDTGRKPEDYDLILSGDLGRHGREILINMLAEYDINLSENYNDTGCMIFDFEKQDVHSGGSGCGCIATVLCGYVYKMLKEKRLNHVLLVGTGALLSPTSSFQGESVPGIAHAISISNI